MITVVDLDRRQRDRGVQDERPDAPRPARRRGRYAIALVCLGNICRSPMADVVLTQRVDDAGLAGRVTVTSCGTGDWHVGQPMDERAAATLRADDYDPSAHRAQQFVRVVAGRQRPGARDGRAQPRGRTPRRSAGRGPAEPDRVRLFGDFDPVEPGGEVPDPYYGGDARIRGGAGDGGTDLRRPRLRPPAAARPPRSPVSAGRARDVTRQPVIAKHAEELLGSAVVATAPLAGGDTSAATKLRLSDGTTAIMKTHAHPPAGFFAAEAARAALAGRGRRRRRGARAGGARRRRGVPDPALGRARQGLARRRHRLRPGAGHHPCGRRGVVRRARRTASSASCRCPTRPCDTWAEFYAVRRVLPYLKLARDRGAIGEAEAVAGRARDRQAHRRCCPRSRRPGCTATCGTATCSGARRARVWLIDPAAYGGHRELDLAMLALFGMPHLPRVLDAYQEARPPRRGLGGAGRRCTSCSRCWCTPPCSAAATAPGPPRPPRATPDVANGLSPQPPVDRLQPDRLAVHLQLLLEPALVAADPPADPLHVTVLGSMQQVAAMRSPHLPVSRRITSPPACRTHSRHAGRGASGRHRR